MAIWLIVGASRGIGLEFVTQLLGLGHIVIATARAPATAPQTGNSVGSGSKLWDLARGPNGNNLTILECDVSDEGSIQRFAGQVGKLGRKGAVLEKGVIDVVVLNAGVLVYPNRISELLVLLSIQLSYLSMKLQSSNLSQNRLGLDLLSAFG
ncbi:hypothetical protein M430DRAFT_25481 [Amorphotheca resinae ATCC 22711]|jgi:NAD(P)-dependent dehydrogenase (short-subunit alcohol dehydrogenase family)|uniref:Ketoreductase (KR) domain-containing protein n=1 Tax=Amorphotheca resinae ATCC 22711 TaxID=857342 RepID=A0A2T3BBN7_AMORE|nr:hypothetical protein M430DRAFT_25481 [Amorphotheca resinae ATCC 22711]PSS25720.1 hypothetical protein M430DRAFT_25481 [Amorphotheca resinae ATCC 22711]